MANFPPIGLRDPEVSQSAQWSGEMEVQPFVDRPAPQEWRFLFHRHAEREFGGDWKGAAFLRCSKDDDLGVIGERFAAVAEATNAEYSAALDRGEETPERKTFEEVESISAASVDPADKYPVYFP